MKKVRGILITVICISLVVGLYYYVSNNASKKSVENDLQLTEVEKVLTRDLEKSYLLTPREVIKFYNRAICCLYNDEYTDEQFLGLADQIRCLMDEELLEENPADTYYESLKKDVEEYRAREKKIVNTTVSDSADVQYKKVNGRECAYVSSSYFITEGSESYTRPAQRYVLRKDEAENWKMLGFYLLEGDSSDD